LNFVTDHVEIEVKLFDCVEVKLELLHYQNSNCKLNYLKTEIEVEVKLF